MPPQIYDDGEEKRKETESYNEQWGSHVEVQNEVGDASGGS